ncbi:hypothetical protein P152DRAFT_223853 [Eremomyces bilateralis CBS 781.70]|uniref:UDENN FLCN/SMCR8-type domain-containing protein n=1 Tax=Eremomyces bilateralis CBS 781.70 TaxID=1392243 RepID=A0A6G1FRK2_9PEZI|nr:uncharacterized protein P152DRAFT_223853 [Eremomyces bilateralis CBS 781.70]KAF1808358.1 hypothetical protein P152DRAFT_223853 [Eremomyces bilateralis CBS 781.70]
MEFILSLAHFCEVHGPTSILCTQVDKVSCNASHPCRTPSSGKLSKSSSFSTQNSSGEEPTSARPDPNPSLDSPLQTPPTSPRWAGSGSQDPYFGVPGGHLGYGQLGNPADDCDECENCTFLVSKDMSQRLPDGAPGSPTKDGKGRHGAPILRTKQRIQVGDIQFRSSDDDDDDTTVRAPVNRSLQAKNAHIHPQLASVYSGKLTPSPPSANSSMASSPLNLPKTSSPYPMHTHTLTYITTRQPSTAASYSLLRRTCIRSLSTENLPRGSPSGPILFGDPIAGYAIAYVFKLRDPRARGRYRTYALLGLGVKDSWKVTKVYVELVRMFENIASKIIAMTDRVLEKESQKVELASAKANANRSDLLKHTANGASRPNAASEASRQPTAGGSSAPSSTAATVAAATRNFTPVSSFLSAKMVDPDGHPRGSRDPRDAGRSKCLAEIVGNPNFFVDLHAQFCLILSELIKEFEGR